ncbi:dynamin family protein [Dactylosporangium sp. CA-092794]|uniref:dynamin family protein n=1 Tax=Dactylosporangium sp. CA-092794 TaxID=3239929 RepID=UPI003D8CAC57
MSLQDEMGAARRIAQSAREAIDDLAGVGRELENEAAVELLTGIGEKLSDDTFALMALGRFNVGKSTLINALLAGSLDLARPDQGIVPIGAEATTPTLILLEYSDDPYVRVTCANGAERDQTLDQFRTGYVLDSNEARNAEQFGEITTCRIGLPAELLRQRVAIYDTPGMADSLGRDEITRDALQRCDAAIAVYRMGEYGHYEVEAEHLAREEEVQIFTVVNSFGQPVTDARHQSVWNKLVLPRTGIEYAGQDLAGQRVYFVDAQAALLARAAGAPTGGTGLDELERDLADFLLTERQSRHITRYVAAAVAQTEVLGRATAVAIEIASRETRPDLIERLEALRPRLAEIAHRRDRIPRTVMRARRAAMSAVRTDFSRLMYDIERRLPGVLRTAPLPSWRESFVGSKFNAMRQRKLVDEMSEVARKFAADAVRDWRETARDLVAEQIDELLESVAVELQEIQDEYADAFAALAGWSPDQIRGDQAVRGAERWTAGLVGALLGGGPVGAIAAAGGGKKAVVYGLAAQIAAYAGLALAGATAPVVLPVVVAAGIVAALAGANLTRDKLVESFLAKGLPSLMEEFRKHEKELTDEISRTFDRLSDELTRNAAALVAAEERNFDAVAAQNGQSDQEREAGLKALAALRDRIDNARVTLESLAAAAAYGLGDES